MAPTPPTTDQQPHRLPLLSATPRFVARDDVMGSSAGSLIGGTLGIIIAIIVVIAILMLLINLNRKVKNSEAEAEAAKVVVQSDAVAMQRIGMQQIYGSKPELDGMATEGEMTKRMELEGEDTARHEMAGSDGVRPVEMPAWRMQAANETEPKSLAGGAVRDAKTSEPYGHSKKQPAVKKGSSLHWSWSRGIDVY